MRESCQRAGFGLTKAQVLEKDRKSVLPRDDQLRLRGTDVLIRSELGPEALRALSDFGYFQKRYFGRIAYPWQVTAAETVVELLASPDKEYLVVNCPPGAGKSTLFTHDIPAWLTVKNRSIRGMIGSATTQLATGYVDRLRRTLARTLPVKCSDDDLTRGLALDAESTLSADYGRFQPVGDIWTRDSFVVQQYEDMGQISEKNPREIRPRPGRRLHRPWSTSSSGTTWSTPRSNGPSKRRKPSRTTGTMSQNQDSSRQGCSSSRARGSRRTICTATAGQVHRRGDGRRHGRDARHPPDVPPREIQGPL